MTGIRKKEVRRDWKLRDTHSQDNDSKNADCSNKNLLIAVATVLQFPVYITHLFLPFFLSSFLPSFLPICSDPIKVKI